MDEDGASQDTVELLRREFTDLAKDREDVAVNDASVAEHGDAFEEGFVVCVAEGARHAVLKVGRWGTSVQYTTHGMSFVEEHVDGDTLLSVEDATSTTTAAEAMIEKLRSWVRQHA